MAVKLNEYVREIENVLDLKRKCEPDCGIGSACHCGAEYHNKKVDKIVEELRNFHHTKERNDKLPTLEEVCGEYKTRMGVTAGSSEKTMFSMALNIIAGKIGR